MSNRLDTLTCEAFTPYLNQTFEISLENSNLESVMVTHVDIPGLTLGKHPSLRVTLTEAKTLRPSPFEGRRDDFSLLFRGPEGITLSAGIYRLTHPEIEPLDLFLNTVFVNHPQDLAFESVFA